MLNGAAEEGEALKGHSSLTTAEQIVRGAADSTLQPVCETSGSPSEVWLTWIVVIKPEQ